jgi:hypothetical protein
MTSYARNVECISFELAKFFTVYSCADDRMVKLSLSRLELQVNICLLKYIADSPL